MARLTSSCSAGSKLEYLGSSTKRVGKKMRLGVAMRPHQIVSYIVEHSSVAFDSQVRCVAEMHCILFSSLQ